MRIQAMLCARSLSKCQLVLVARPIVYVCERSWCGRESVCVNPEALMREVLLEFLSGVALLVTHSDGKLKCIQRGGVDGSKGL